MNKYSFLIILALIQFACITQDNNPTSKARQTSTNLKKDSCFITIHYKGKRSSSLSIAQRYDIYQLGDEITEPLSDYIIDSSATQALTFRISLDFPTFIRIARSTELYIQPGDSIDLTIMKYKFENSLPIFKINSGTTFFNLPNDTKNIGVIESLLDSLFLNAINNHKNIYTVEFARTNAAIMFQRLVETFPVIKTDKTCNQFMQDLCLNAFYQTITYQALKNNGKLSKEVYSVLAYNSHKYILSFLDKKFWGTYSNVTQSYLNRFIKYNFNCDSILRTIEPYNDTIQQFFLMTLLKKQKNAIIKDSNNYKSIVNKISYPPFKRYLNQIEASRLPEGNGFLSYTLQNAPVYTYQLKEMRFIDIFSNTKQPYIAFDFCGTWCIPCLEEIKKYSIQKHLDESTTIRPVWLFFEKDSTKWKAVVNKYGLKKGNCFVIFDDNKFRKPFNTQYTWRGEFPHHSIFQQQGRIIKSNAPSLTDIDKNEVLRLGQVF